MIQSGTVAGYFSSRTEAESAVSALQDAGFTRNEIGLAIREGDSGRGKWERIKGFFGREQEERPESYRNDDLHASMSGLSVGDEHARYFRHRFGSGSEGAIVTVSASGREDEAQQVLEENGGDVGASASSYDYGEAESTANEGATAADRDLDQQNIQLYGEVLRVHTDRVSRGEARLHKEVHTTTQSVEVPVTREELVIERVPVSGEQAADSASFEEKEIRIPLSEERARVEKQPVVREEVRVGKKAVSDIETFKEQVRSEDLKVDEDASEEPKRKTA